MPLLPQVILVAALWISLFSDYCLLGKQTFGSTNLRKTYKMSDAMKPIFKDFQGNPEDQNANRNLDADLSPKPTIFFPSIAERELQKAGTYLCLLEDFFPDVIKTDWQEKDDKTILTSQQGDAIKTNDTYMKFSWLTVTGASLDKEHKCIVKHERNKGGVDQEILFSSHIKATLQLQLATTSAYYTYLFVLLKNGIYSAVIASALCANGKSS
ncbi:hypothetical protein PANDA_001523 [Ailuropoda melanoleuca]|uniref:Ig-like domain-containing protein n=1 Tax=Ailuropoda melanoleuca TaxID=9646 RepID=D2GXB1_AILME|nr:hypothetical protein PANDA_001523 [Ailuropoda melanoleuca]